MTGLVALVAALGFGLLGVPHVASGQQPGKVARIGYLSSGGAVPARQQMFEQSLREHGWMKDQNLVIDYRRADGNYARLPALAAELVRLEPQVIVTATTAAARAAKDATSTIPIVMMGVSDPIGSGLIASFARPGGNVTGITGTLPFETYTKQLQLLRDVVPGARRIGLLWNPNNSSSLPGVKTAEEAARSLGLELHVVRAQTVDEFEPAFRTLTQARVDALIVMQEAMFDSHFARLADASIKRRLPSICGLDGYARAGGLMTYSVSFADSFRRIAGYVDRILRGANPTELPVERPTKFDLVINVKTAKALGITVPRPLILQADQVIE
jgi:putative ABC transport system substrate-binding protein